MKQTNNHIGKLFLGSALLLLLLALCFGLLASLTYLFPDFLKDSFNFTTLRPLHVSMAMFWILLGASGCVYSGIQYLNKTPVSEKLAYLQWILWIIAISGILFSYFTKNFGGREYWEFKPVWALPIALAWILFLINFFTAFKKIGEWPVYIWMWMTGILFFLFTFIENYLWIFPYFRSHFITDMTIQWKVNGSLVGAWNQLLYGTAFFLMDKITNTQNTGKSKLAFLMYFLGLFNLMFNWGHHIYTLPTAPFIKYLGYIVSMTEWVFFVKIIYSWKSTVQSFQKHYHYFPYRFLMAADFWVFINMGQAILMSIPAINIYTHGTHITVAHAMGTTIGINSMILFAACFEFLNFPKDKSAIRFPNGLFWLLQLSLLVFWLSLNLAGIQKGIWQLNSPQSSFAVMMDSLRPYFTLFFISGLGLAFALGGLAVILMWQTWKKASP
ncbi:MAG: cbb3-type cytochrome c oxidase subunit I [Chitinophagaceae bacterium]|nr:cbb3-type cytochrome c oxidase subunit I [Chitinophagaceae bacterium]